MPCLNCGKDVGRGSRICVTCANLALGNLAAATSNYTPASITRRGYAALIESLLWLILTLAVYFAALLINLRFNEQTPFWQQLGDLILAQPEAFFKKVSLQATIALNALMIVYAGAMSHFYGATLGKVMLGLIIINQKSRQVINWWQGILREWFGKYGIYLAAFYATAYVPSTLAVVIYGLIGIASLIHYLLAFFNADKQALHDILASTVVIDR